MLELQVVEDTATKLGNTPESGYKTNDALGG